MTLKIDVKFEGKPICPFKNDISILGNFYQSTWKPPNRWDSFIQSQKIYVFRIYRGVILNDNEKRCKIGSGIVLSFQKWREEFHEFWPEQSKISKICTLTDCLWPKYVMFELKKYRGIMFDSTEYWGKIWRKTEFCFQKWHEEFGKFSPQHSKVSKLGFWWDSFM